MKAALQQLDALQIPGRTDGGHGDGLKMCWIAGLSGSTRYAVTQTLARLRARGAVRSLPDRCASDAGKPPPFGGRPASLAHHQPSRQVSGCRGLESLRPFRATAKAAFA